MPQGDDNAMATLRRYVLVETLKIFLVTIAVTLLLMVLGGGAKEGLKQGLPLQMVVQLLPYMVPEMLRFTIPGCLLFAVCTVFSRMTAAQEITAVKALGINPLVLIWPVLQLAFALSLVTFTMYDVCAVWSRPNLRRIVVDSVDRVAYGFLKTNGAFQSQGISIVVKGVQGDRLLQPVISVEPRGPRPAVTVVAKQARLDMDRRGNSLRIECEQGRLDVAGRGSFHFPDRFLQAVSLGEPDPCPENHLSPAALCTRSVWKQISRQQRLVAEVQSPRTTETAAQPAADDRGGELQAHRARLFRLQAEVPRRWANGVGCLCFALLGIPIAMRSRSSDTMSVFFACFLPILLVYYPLLVTGENLARAGVYPQLSVWLANAVLFAVGATLTWRSLKH
jgi:lipopolysaccharide export system permease protein